MTTLCLLPALLLVTAQDGREPAAQVLDEITVTAQKREDRLQDVPLKVSVLTAAEIEEHQLDTSLDIAARVPGLEIKSAFSASNPTVFLRGVGLNDFNVNASGTVGFYVDEVYVASPSAQVFQLYDLQRIEVLHGPQGTLYGRNTTGGAIHLVTRKPGDRLGGRIRGTLGRFDQTDLEGAIDLPLPGKSNALRLSASSHNRGGHTKNLFDDSDENDIARSAARLLLRVVPRDDFALQLKIHGGVNRSTARAYQSRGLIDGADILGYVETTDPFTGSYNRDTREDLDLFGSSLVMSWQMRSFAVTSISAYEQSERLVLGDEDASPNQLVEIDWFNHAEQISQEIRFASSQGNRLSWLAGAYYFDEDLDVDNLFDSIRELRPRFGFDPSRSIFALRQLYRQSTTSTALFGQASYRAAGSLTLRIGLRATDEEREIIYATSLEEPSFSIPLIDFAGQVGDEALSGEIGLDYRLDTERLFYASIRRGFKSGGFNGGALFDNQQLEPVDPEFLTSLELGLKSSWFGHQLRVDVSAFYYDYRDLQVFNFVNVGDLSIQRLDNASDARVRGLEIDLETKPTPRLELHLRLALLDAVYRDFVLNDGSDFSGNRLIAAPRISWYLSLARSWEVAGGRLVARADFDHRSEVFFDPRSIPRIGAEDSTLANARLTFDGPRSRYSVSLWARNLSDEVYLSDVLDVSGFGFDQLVFGDPRTYGIEISARF